MGVVVQLIAVGLYKSAMWCFYIEAEKGDAKKREEIRNKWWYKLVDGVSESYRLEIFFDGLTVVCFVLATILLLCSIFG